MFIHAGKPAHYAPHPSGQFAHHRPPNPSFLAAFNMESPSMHSSPTPLDYQLQLALAKRDTQLRRSMLRRYLAETNGKQSLSFRARAFTSSILFATARMIKPCRPHRPSELWVPETQSAS